MDATTTPMSQLASALRCCIGTNTEERKQAEHFMEQVCAVCNACYAVDSHSIGSVALEGTTGATDHYHVCIYIDDWTAWGIGDASAMYSC